jgi:ABC-type transport system involved in multi-copper enzyme maturation permease subunit
MTALSTLNAPTHLDEDTNLGQMPWRRMAWVTWRQHRSALTGIAVLFLAIAAAMSIAGIKLRHAHAVAVACKPASSFACNSLVNTFDGMYGFLSNGFILQVVPGLVGAFLGAPVLARELESGTFRFAWTQGFGRWRWTLAKLVALGVVVAVAAGALSVLFSWYYQPYFPASSQALYVSKALPIGTSSPFAPGLFDLRGVSFAAWTLAAFAIGIVAGVLVRRVVPAIVATLVAYTGLAFAAGGFLRAHYLAPLATHSLTVPDTAWVITQQWFTNNGRLASKVALNETLQHAPGQLFGKGGVPKSVTVWQYLAHHGFTQLTSYQPASRFWPFQWIEGGWLLALSVLCLAATVLLVRRRAT